jgi:hypothetical protein
MRKTKKKKNNTLTQQIVQGTSSQTPGTTYAPAVYSPCCPLVSKLLPKGSGTGMAGGLNIWVA